LGNSQTDLPRAAQWLAHRPGAGRQDFPAIVTGHAPGSDRLFTASMGVAALAGEGDFTALYERAEKLLYEAKSAGRNRTRTAEESPAREGREAVELSKAG